VVQTAAAIRILAVAFWVGGMAALDFIEAPLRFASGVITRNQAVALGQGVILRWHRVEWTLAVIVLVASLLAASPRWSIWLAGLMLAIVTVQGAYLIPALTRLSQGLDFVQRAPQDPRYVTIRHLHSASAALELIVLIGGAVLLAATVRPGKR
jgi:uncharacterized membrane protein